MWSPKMVTIAPGEMAERRVEALTIEETACGAGNEFESAVIVKVSVDGVATIV